MTRSVISSMPKIVERPAAGTAHGVDSGHFRTLPWTARTGDGECLYLGLRLRTQEAIPRGDAQDPPIPQDLILLYGPRPEHRGFQSDFVFFRISCSHLGITGAEARHLADTQVSTVSGVGALVSRFLCALIGEDELRHSVSGRRLSHNAVDLVALLVAELLGPYRSESAVGGGEILARIREYIEENLMDPDMSPESIARAHHISVRYLHKLFQSDGTTVSTWIRQRRLDSCRADLGRLSNRRRTVAAVAQSWGFANPSHFSRLFRQAYGVSPSEWQTSLNRT